MKKFILIPILIIAYIYFINFTSTMSLPSMQIGTTVSPPGGGGEAIGVGESVSVTVTRQYLFGLVRLPVYNQFGNIALYHDIFFYFIIVLTVIFIIQEIKYKKKRRGTKMAKKANWMSFVKAIVWGIVFALIAFILSGDASSIVIGLLVMYLEYKLGKLK